MVPEDDLVKQQVGGGPSDGLSSQTSGGSFLEARSALKFPGGF